MKNRNQKDVLFESFQNHVLEKADLVKGGQIDEPRKLIYASRWCSDSGIFLEGIYSDGSKKYFSVIGTEVSANYLISNNDNQIESCSG